MSNIFTADPNRFIPAGANGGVPGPPNGGGMFGMIASNGLLPPPMPPAPPIQLEMPPALSGAKKPRDIHSLLREGMKAQPRACGVPIAKRSLAELKADEKKTGIKVRDDLPPDFPRGPWVADLSKPPDHAPASGCHDGGWKYQEEQMVVQWKCWCSDPNTPLDYPGLDLNKYHRGGFQIAGTTRSVPTAQTGTVKRARCTGRTEGDKGEMRPCSFKIQAEFVSEVLPGKHGWVLRSVEGCNHILSDACPAPYGGKSHALVHSRSAVMESGRLRKGTARLRQAEYFKTGMRMKVAGNSCAMIHETLRVVAEEEGREALWNMADIKEVFGLDPKKRAADDDSGFVEDKHQRCLIQCGDLCAKVNHDDDECDLFYQHLIKFEKQLNSRRRKRKATTALESEAPGGDEDQGASSSHSASKPPPLVSAHQLHQPPHPLVPPHQPPPPPGLDASKEMSMQGVNNMPGVSSMQGVHNMQGVSSSMQAVNNMPGVSSMQGVHNMQGVSSSMQAVNSMPGVSSMQGVNNMQGVSSSMQAVNSMPGVNSMQGLNSTQ